MTNHGSSSKPGTWAGEEFEQLVTGGAPAWTGRFREADLAKIKSSMEEQERLHQRVKHSKSFSKHEQQALAINSFDDFKPYWEITLGGKKDFDSLHDRGVGRLGQNLDSFGASAYDVIQKLDPLIGIVKDSGVPYVGMALGIMTFCFAVAKNRRKMESQISQTLLAIQDRLPGIKMYKEIYSSAGIAGTSATEVVEHLHSKMVDAYDSFVNFCIVTVDFYAMGSFRRRLHAVGNSSLIESQAVKVQNSVIAFKSVCEELLSANIHTILCLNEGLTVEVQSLTHKLKDLTGMIKDNHYHEALDKVKAVLKIKSWSETEQMTQLAQHRDNVTAEFRHTYASPLTPDERLHQVKSHPSFLAWEASAKSCILVLSGCNELIATAHCWLSPVAIDLIMKLAGKKPRDPFAFYVTGTQKEEDSFQQVLSFIILRLLELNPETLQEQGKRDEFLAALSAYAEVAIQQIAGDQAGVRLIQSLLVKVASATLRLFDTSKTVWIVLDRLDRCRSVNASSARNLQRKALLKGLIRLVEEDGPGPKLRVLTVVNAVDWQVEEQADELDMDRAKGDRLILQTLHQNERRY